MEEFKRKHRKMRKSWDLPANFPSAEVVAGYVKARVDECRERFTMGCPDVPQLEAFCREKFGWPAERVRQELEPVLKAFAARESQTTMDNFLYSQRFAKIKSKRLQKAVASITGRANPDINLADAEQPVKQCRKASIVGEGEADAGGGDAGASEQAASGTTAPGHGRDASGLRGRGAGRKRRHGRQDALL